MSGRVLNMSLFMLLVLRVLYVFLREFKSCFFQSFRIDSNYCMEFTKPSVAIHTETNHLICCKIQITGFYMKYNTDELKWVNNGLILFCWHNFVKHLTFVSFFKKKICEYTFYCVFLYKFLFIHYTFLLYSDFKELPLVNLFIILIWN